MAKKIGVEAWADAYVLLKNKTKIFVEETEEEITTQLEKKKVVRLNIAGPEIETINVPINNIDYYGRT